MDNSQYLGIFIEEVKEHLEMLNRNLLLLEKDMNNIDIVNDIFRSAHTIKGMAASMGFDKMEKLTHGIEDILHDVRDGKLEIETKLINILFVGLDFLENSLLKISEEGIEEEGRIDEILNKLHLLIGEELNRKSISETTGVSIEELWTENISLYEIMEVNSIAYTIKITISEDCQMKEVRSFLIFKELMDMGIVINSDPKFDEEDFMNMKLESNDIYVAFVSKLKLDELQDKITSISEVATVEAVVFQGKDDFTFDIPVENKIIDAPVSFKALEINALGYEFINDCLYEILQYTANLDKLMTSETIRKNLEEKYKLFRMFHSIKGLADFIHNIVIKEVAEKTEQLINKYLRRNCEITKTEISLILESIEIIKDEIINFGDNLLEKNTNIHEHLAKLEMNGENQPDKLNDIREIPKDRRIEAKPPEENNPNHKIVDHRDTVMKDDEKKVVEKKENLSKKAFTESSIIKIPVNKIDHLSDLSGELIILQSQLEQSAIGEVEVGNQLFSIMKRMDRITKEIQSATMSLQRVPLKSLFEKLTRIARDTSQELDKKILVEVEGENTEIDRNIVDKLLEPLMHLVRNAIAHGIEDENQRETIGKPSQGMIKIKAESKKNMVIINVVDDGRGISPNKIREKLLSKGLISSSEEYSEKDIINMVFLPGFSTAESINNISGRGVGMDAVRSLVTKLGGKVELESSEGKGTSVKLKIPVTSTAINGTIVEIATMKFVIPTLSIKQILLPQELKIIKVKNKNSMIRYRDEILPIISINKLMGIEEEKEGINNILIIVEHDEELKALPVEGILARREVVIKSLDDHFNHVNFLSGATILGDGKIALILDIESIFANKVCC